MAFPVGFPLFDNDDLRVTLDGEPFSAFTVSGSYINGIAYDAAINAVGIGIVGDVIIEGYRLPRRTDQYKVGGALKIDDHNYSLNRVEATLQELRRDIDYNVNAISEVIGEAQDLVGLARDAADSAEAINVSAGEIAIRSETAAAEAEAAAAAAVGTVPVNTISDLRALNVSIRKSAVVIADGARSGLFRFVTGDIHSYVEADPRSGIYVAPNSDATGFSGAWVRVASWSINGVDPEWFGCAPNINSDQSAAANDVHRFAEQFGCAVAYGRGTWRMDNSVFIYKRGHFHGTQGNGAIHQVGAYSPATRWDFSNQAVGGLAVQINGTAIYAEGVVFEDIDIIRTATPAKGDGSIGLAVVGVSNTFIRRIGIDRFDTLLVTACPADRGGSLTQPNVDLSFEDLYLRNSMTQIVSIQSSINTVFRRGSMGGIYNTPDRLIHVKSGERTSDTLSFEDVLFINNGAASSIANPSEIIRISAGFLIKISGCVLEQATGPAIVTDFASDEANGTVYNLIVDRCHFNGVGHAIRSEGGRINILAMGCRSSSTSEGVFINHTSGATAASKIVDSIFETTADLSPIYLAATKGTTIARNSLFVGGAKSSPALDVLSSSTYNRVIDNDTHTNFSTAEGIRATGAETMLANNKRF